MKTPLLALLLMSFIIPVKAHQKNKFTETVPGQFHNIDQATAPQPEGGIVALMKYMKKFANHEYNNADEGKVTVSFVVEKDGTLSGYKITHSLNAEADGIAIQVLKDYNHKWKPAMQNGQPVNAPYSISVPFGGE